MKSEYPSGWKTLPFKDCILADSTPARIKIQTSKFLSEGTHPIIDQGETFIAGYCDDSALLYPNKGPVVIFGDHTKRIKYVDFPFCVGADGTKVLLPNRNIVEPKFLYYQLLWLPLESGGYSRHYRFLKGKTLVVPPLEAQRRIVAILERAETLKQKRATANEWTAELIKATFLDLFGDPHLNAKGFPVVKMNDVADLSMGGTPNTKVAEYWEGGGVPWMKSGDVGPDFIERVSGEITPLGLKESNAKKYHKGDVVIALNGQGRTRGTSGILDMDTTANQSVASITPNKKKLLPEYLHYNLKIRYKYLRNITGDNERSGLNLRLLRGLEINLPSIERQQKFADALNLCRKIRKNQDSGHEEIAKLFDGLLHKAFAGELVG